MSKRAWTTTELARLQENRELGAAALADLLDRSLWSVKRAAYRQRISLRRPGDARGHVLGQPRTLRLRADVREALRSAPDLYAQRLWVSREASICPDCAHRSIQVETSGLCRPCHARHLERLYREAHGELDLVGVLLDEILDTYGRELDLPRRLQKARQRRKRRLDCEAQGQAPGVDQGER
jgi:hypothetical protein